ncbi:MAG: ParA family protein [Paracoccaceae bacterium]|nr:ParA family protein [Paracoccaceae bacterium]
MAKASVWCLTTPKGGAGKTTLAVALASEIVRLGQRVTLIDADPNAPLQVWYSKGNLPTNITVVVDHQPDGSTIGDLIEAAKATSDFVIVDTEGTNNARATFAIGNSDLVLVPMQSSPEDLRHALRAVAYTKQISKMGNRHIPAILVRTRAGAISDTIEREIDKSLHDTDVEQCQTRLLEKAAFKALLVYGCILSDLPKFSKIGGVGNAQKNLEDVISGIAAAYQKSRKSNNGVAA